MEKADINSDVSMDQLNVNSHNKPAEKGRPESV